MNFVRAGAAFLLHDRRMGTHLWFVLTDPDPQTRLVVVVALVTERAHTERTVRLEPGEHPFVTHASNVDFGSAKYAPSAKIEAGLANRMATLQPNMSPALLARVRHGLLESSHTPNDISRYCASMF